MVARPAGITPMQWRAMSPMEKQLARIPALSPGRRAAIIAEEEARRATIRAEERAKLPPALTRTQIEFLRERAEKAALGKTPLDVAGTPQHKWRVIAGTREPEHKWKVIGEIAVFMGPMTGEMTLKKDILQTAWSQKREMTQMTSRLQNLSDKIEKAPVDERRFLRQQYRNYYHGTYLPTMNKFQQKQSALWERQWEVTGKALWAQGATGEDVNFLRSKLDRWQRQKVTPMEIKRRWGQELKKLESRFAETRWWREYGGRPETFAEWFYKGPGQIPILGWGATGFVKVWEPVGKVIGEAIRGERVPVRPWRAPVPAVAQPFMIAGEVVGTYAMFAPVGRVVGAAARVGSAKVAAVKVPKEVTQAWAVTKRVYPPARVVPPAVRVIRAHPRAITAGFYGIMGAAEVGKVYAMLRAPMYSEAQIEERVKALREAGVSEPEIETQKVEMKRAKAYSAEDIARSVGRDIGMFAGFGVGFRRGMRFGMPIGYERLEIAGIPMGRGIRVGARPLIWKAPGERIGLGYPRPEVAKRLAQKMIPVMKKQVYIPGKMFETKFAFKTVMPHLPKELAGTVIVWERAGVVGWVTPGLRKDILTSLRNQFVRQGMSPADAKELVGYLSGLKKDITIFGSTAKELQWIPELRVQKMYLAHDVDALFPKHEKLLKAVSELRRRFGDKVIINMPEEGTFKIKTLTGNKLFDWHSMKSPDIYAAEEIVWGYPKKLRVFTTEGWKFSTLGSEHINELATHGWTIKGGKVLFASRRTKDTIRMMLSGYSNSIAKYGVKRGIQFYKPAADFLKSQLVAQGIPAKDIPRLLAESAKDPAAYYLPYQAPGLGPTRLAPLALAVVRPPLAVKDLPTTLRGPEWKGLSPAQRIRVWEGFDPVVKERWITATVKAKKDVVKWGLAHIRRMGALETATETFKMALEGAKGGLPYVGGRYTSRLASSLLSSAIPAYARPYPPYPKPRKPPYPPTMAPPTIPPISYFFPPYRPPAKPPKPPYAPPYYAPPPTYPPPPYPPPPYPPPVTPPTVTPPPPPFILPGEGVRRRMTKREKEFWEKERKRAFDVRVFLRDLMGGVGAGAR